MTRPPLALLLRLRRRAGEDEIADRIAALVLLLLWAELAASSLHNDHKPAWMRTGGPTRRPRALRRARRTTAGRRARG